MESQARAIARVSDRWQHVDDRECFEEFQLARVMNLIDNDYGTVKVTRATTTRRT